MLILTRNIGEALIIDRDIIIRILGYQQRQVRLGIEAPRSIEVHRKEIMDRIIAEEWQASQDDIQ